MNEVAEKREQRCWVAAASAEHVRIGRHGGFMEVCPARAARCAVCGRANWGYRYCFGL